MIKEHYERVRKILTFNPECRDSDNKLMAIIWQEDLDNKDENTNDFFLLLGANKLSSFESITRCRRKLQEQYHNLRGQKWMQRHEQECEVVQEIREMNQLKEKAFEETKQKEHHFETERGTIKEGNLFKE